MGRIEKCRRPLITSHIRVDGDALGAELGLAHILKARGIEPRIVNDGRIPKIYEFLPGSDQVEVSPDQAPEDCDLIIALDIPCLDRTGELFARLLKARHPVVIIDHHPPVGNTSELEWRDLQRSSTGEMIADLAFAADWEVSPEAATCLYAAILTDTGRFVFPNTNPATLRVAAQLMELGADCIRVGEEIYQQESYNVAMLRAEALQTIELHAEDRIAVMHVTLEMLARTKVDPIDTNGFADMPRALAGVDVGVLLREMEGRVKVSLRSRKSVNIEPVARRFGGGGHYQAAGCEIPGGLAEATHMVLQALAAHLGANPQGGAD